MSWQDVINTHEEANFLQSPAWAKTNELIGDKTITLEFENHGHALMIVRNAKRGRYLEIPCGPLIDWQDSRLVRQVFDKIYAVAKENRCVFARLRPQLRKTPENLVLLQSLGLKPSPMHLAAEHTVIIDLTKSEDDLLKDMRRQTRYEVRRSDKEGIKVTKCSDEAAFKEFHSIQLATARRQNFVPPSFKLLMAEREAFDDNITIYKATKDAPIALGLIISDGHEAAYYEAASTDLNRKLPGAYAILWQAMKDLKAQGVKRFNLWGIAPPGQPNHRYAGVTTFKTGFGGEIVEYVPAHDLIISKPKYLKNLLVETMRKKKRHL